jgi:hypothetical protein
VTGWPGSPGPRSEPGWLLDGDFPRPGPMRQIAEHHTRKLLEMRL